MKKDNRAWAYSARGKHEMKMLDDAGRPYPEIIPEEWKEYATPGNPFVRLSQHDQQQLARDKAFMMRLLDQIREAYGNVKHVEETAWGDNTQVTFGCHPNDGCIHYLTVNKGVVTYKPRLSMYPQDAMYHKIMRQDPQSFETKNERTASAKIILKDDDTLDEQLQMVVWCLEKDGFTLRR